jgi:hypothetical protein
VIDEEGIQGGRAGTQAGNKTTHGPCDKSSCSRAEAISHTVDQRSVVCLKKVYSRLRVALVDNARPKLLACRRRPCRYELGEVDWPGTQQDRKAHFGYAKKFIQFVSRCGTNVVEPSNKHALH